MNRAYTKFTEENAKVVSWLRIGAEPLQISDPHKLRNEQKIRDEVFF